MFFPLLEIRNRNPKRNLETTKKNEEEFKKNGQYCFFKKKIAYQCNARVFKDLNLKKSLNLPHAIELSGNQYKNQ